MSLSMYQASVPVLIRNIAALSAILGKAERSAQMRAIDPQSLVAARLAPHMHPLAHQIEFVSIHAKGIGFRLAQIEMPFFDDNDCTDATIPTMQTRLAKTIAFLKGLQPDQFEGSESRSIAFTRHDGMRFKFTGQQYLLNFAFPNFYFHYSIAYAILRENGVPIGKADFLA